MSARRGPQSVFAVATAMLSLCGCERPRGDNTSPVASASAPAAAVVASAPAPVAGPEERLEPLRQRTYAVVIDGTLAHVGTEAGVTTLDLQRPDDPKALANTTLPDSVNNLTMLGSARKLLAVAVGPSGLAIVDASAAASGKLQTLNTVPWTASQRGACHSVWKAVSGASGQAYVACGTGGVAEADLKDAANPRVQRTLATDDYVRDVAVLDAASGVGAAKASSSLVAVAAGHAGLLIVDFGAAGAPKVLSRLETTGETRAIAVRGGLAYLAEGAAGLRIVDLRDPSRPAVVGSIRPETTDMLRGVVVDERTAWLCAGDSGLLAMDVSVPASPRLAGVYNPERAINRAALLPNAVVAANDADGLLILDAKDTASLRPVYPKAAAK